ncbi:MAG: cupin domain-containing protein [Spirochaetes bacterium]|nr:cupin domain-containing protein [Spirochaetota bacterium]
MITYEHYSVSTIANEFACRTDASEILPALIKKGYTVYGVDQKVNQLVPYHTHPSQEVVIVLQGTVRYTVEEEIVDVSEGEIIRIMPSSVHASVSVGGDDAKLLLTFI